ncbi:winged helix-turn-helix domain-containing protein [Streptomyces sp. NPDC053474]|uniref:winged helix-turn-helix domain-containing protein n=1 Tax=Streptomyces sp. NPDC053474 TaxID=3365704 RepID=UPI0037D51E7E
MPGRSQWLATTAGRIAQSGACWLEAVLWFNKYGPAVGASHGPTKVGSTTLRLAQILARLNECRPSVGVLVDWLQLSERTVQYHLRILREAGLLTYRSKGTRISGIGGRASMFALTIPPLFDTAAGLRTRPSATLIRAVTGFSQDHLPLLKRLHAEARRLLKRNRPKRPNRPSAKGTSPHATCTPKVGSTSSRSPAGHTPLPSENDFDAGKHKPAPPRNPSDRKQNHVARRYQLAAQLIRQIPWLHQASTQRIAWIVRHVADAGWSATEVAAVVGQEAAARRIHRPSGFLAHRLKGVHLLYNTPDKRAAAVTWWQGARSAQQERHAEWTGACPRPPYAAVPPDAVGPYLALPAPSTAHSLPQLPVDQDGLVDHNELDRAALAELRATALTQPALVHATARTCGEAYTRQLFTPAVVDHARRLTRLGRTVVHTWRPT